MALIRHPQDFWSGVLFIALGGGALLSAFASYTIEKKIAKDSSRFGNGAIQGVAGPESAPTS